ncbi:MAG: outer membrane protein assembly factor BamB family protein, partial [Planctomycetota bacterium]
MGVSTDGNLPEQWSHDSANIKWKARLLGEGCSSPIVSGNRVFVTTAYEKRAPGIVRRVTASAGCLLGTIVLAAILARLITGGRGCQRHRQTMGRSLGQTLSAGVTGVSTTLALLLLILLYVFPEQYDATVGKSLAQAFGTYDTEHLFYIGKEVAAATWLNTGAAALLGFAAALHWLRARSVWRPIGGVAFVGLAVAFVTLTPMDAWKYRVPLWTLVLFAGPAALVATWHLLGYLEIRRGDQQGTAETAKHNVPFLQSLNSVRILWKHEDPYHFGGASSVVLFASMAALAVLAFLPANLIVPRMGVQRAVTCLDFTSGEILWQTRIFAAPAERKHRDNSYATPTPAADGQHVAVHFGVGTACLNLDGRVLWKVSDPLYPDDTRYGAAASVLIWKNRTIVLQESEERTKRRTWLAAFDTASGDLLWKARPTNLRMAYTTGLLHDDGAGVKLIIASFRKILCFELESGRLLWQHDITMEQIVASLTRGGPIFCVGGGTWGPKG